MPGEIIYADGGAFDENWVDVLYGEALHWVMPGSGL